MPCAQRAPQLPEQWLAPTAQGFAVVRVDPEDTGLWDMLTLSLNRIEQEQKSKAAEDQQKTISAVLTLVKTLLSQFVHPAVYTYTFYTPGQQPNRYVTVVQLRNLGTWFILKMVLNSNVSEPVERIKDAELYTVGQGDANASGTVLALANRAFSWEAISNRSGRFSHPPPQSQPQPRRANECRSL